MSRPPLLLHATRPMALLAILVVTMIYLVPEPTPEELAQARPPLTEDVGMVKSLAFASDGKSLATVGRDGIVTYWDVSTGRGRAIPLDPVGLDCFAFAPDLKTMIRGLRDGTVTVWNVESGGGRATRWGRAGTSLTALAFNGKELALGEDGGAVRLVDVAAGRERCTLVGNTRLISCLVFAPDGKTLAAGHLGGSITVWDTTTEQARAVLVGHRSTAEERQLAGVLGLAFSSDGTVLASVGCFDRCVKLWDVATGREKAILSGHPSRLLSVAYVRGGGVIAAGGQDGGITLWDAPTGRVRASWRAHADQVQGLAFSADGALLASGGADAIVRFWDVARVLTSGVTASRPPARGTPAHRR